jgi:surfeit locus 1 family protein
LSTRAPHSPWFLGGAALTALLLFAALIALGTWQVHRRAWKLDLIDRVEHRVHAPPVPAPDPAGWPKVTAATDEYRRVTATGIFLTDAETLVQAATELGSGYWVVTPLWLNDGNVILVNRGFIPPELRDHATRTAAEPMGPTTVTGLMRMTEPGGGFLRHNDPENNRWYSRDVQAIAAARGLTRVAPFFIDAQGDGARKADPKEPVAGLTVIAFHNNHLMYAITWYTLALMVVGAVWLGIREERRLRQ